MNLNYFAICTCGPGTEHKKNCFVHNPSQPVTLTTTTTVTNIDMEQFKSYTTGTISIHWGIHNRVDFGLAFFEDNKMVEVFFNYEIVKKVLRNFIPKVKLSFIKQSKDFIKVDKKYWDETLNPNQNGIVRYSITRGHAPLKKIKRQAYFDCLINGNK